MTYRDPRPLRLYEWGEETRICARCRQRLPSGVKHAIIQGPDCVNVSVYVIEVNGVVSTCEGVPVPSRAEMS